MEGERDNLAWQVGAHREEKQRLQDELQNLQAAPKNADFTKLQESSATIINNLREETRILQSRLATARADLATIQNQLSESQRAPADEHQLATEIEFPEPADLLNQLKGRRKKSKVELADIAEILEILELRNHET